MEIPVTMPKLGLIMTEGRIVQWLKSIGDSVKVGEPLLVIETDKVSIEVESPTTGVLSTIEVEAQSVVPIGTVIGTIFTAGEEADEFVVSDKLRRQEEAQVEPVVHSGLASDTKRPGRLKATPVARRMAKDRGIDLSLVRGTGVQGAITKEDILAFAEHREAEEPPTQEQDEIVELTPIRRVAAERLTESFRSTPHFYLTVEADMSALLLLRDQLTAEAKPTAQPKPTVTDIVLWSVARCLRKHPELNASWGTGRVRLQAQTGIALAVSTEQGLVAPVLRDRDLQSLDHIVRRREDIVGRARIARLTLDDFEGGTFTLTNLGMYGIDTFDPIINPPQCAILAIGAIKDRVIVHEGQPVVRPTAHFTLAADHRVLDGVVGASFLQDLVDLIENPWAEMELHSRLEE